MCWATEFYNRSGHPHLRMAMERKRIRVEVKEMRATNPGLIQSLLLRQKLFADACALIPGRTH